MTIGNDSFHKMLKRFGLFETMEISDNEYNILRKERPNEYIFSLSEIEFFIKGITQMTY